MHESTNHRCWTGSQQTPPPPWTEGSIAVNDHGQDSPLTPSPSLRPSLVGSRRVGRVEIGPHLLATGEPRGLWRKQRTLHLRKRRRFRSTIVLLVVIVIVSTSGPLPQPLAPPALSSSRPRRTRPPAAHVGHHVADPSWKIRALLRLEASELRRGTNERRNSRETLRFLRSVNGYAPVRARELGGVRANRSQKRCADHANEGRRERYVGTEDAEQDM